MLLEDFADHVVAAGINENSVEVVVCFQCGQHIGTVQSGFEIRCSGLHFLNILVGYPGDRDSCRQFVHGRNDLLNMCCCYGVKGCDECGAARLGSDEACAFQSEECLADRGSAGAEPFDQLDVAEPFAGREGSVDDRVAEGFVHVVAKQRSLVNRMLQWNRHATYYILQIEKPLDRKGKNMTLADFERYPLTFGPSPIHKLSRLSNHLGGATVWAKREDVSSGLAFGGNKVRKMEYIVPDILAQGADTLVSIGGYQSNHTRQVAAVAAHLGVKAVLVQENWVDWPDSLNDRVGNIELSRIMGAEVRLDPAGFDIGIRDSWTKALADVEERGGKPYAIPAGASEHRLGGLGFANWAYEVEQQERELGVFFDTIIVCAVTGSTHAGMIAGFAGQERPRRVIGIDASATLQKSRDQVARIARHTAELIGLGRDLRDDEIIVMEGWAGDHYGIPVESTLNAIRMVGSMEGVILDPVYEGKSMAGLIDLVSSKDIPQDSNVLYAHLGGQLALNAYSALFR